jgi:hypothetical protein
MTRPQDGTGEVFIERRDGMDGWRAAWMCSDERDVLTASELGPNCATLDECIAWALHEARPARVSINPFDLSPRPGTRQAREWIGPRLPEASKGEQAYARPEFLRVHLRRWERASGLWVVHLHHAHHGGAH